MKNVFFLPCNNKFIIYAPLSGFVSLITSYEKDLILKKINKKTEFDKKLYAFYSKKLKKKIGNLATPKNGVLCISPTLNCNLSCRYCFSDPNQSSDHKIDDDMIKEAILHCIRKSKESFTLEFCGGGEPTLKMDLIKRTIDFAKEQCSRKNLKLNLLLFTNLIVSKKTLEFIKETFSTIQVSIDGFKRIHDFQRPLLNGKPSFRILDKNLKELSKSNKKILLRTTITDYNIKYMLKILKFFYKRYSIKYVHFEPLFSSERSLKNKLNTPDPRIFLKEYIKALDFAEKNNIHLKLSGTEPFEIKNNYCSLNFILTHEGKITSCYETIGSHNQYIKKMEYGKWDFSKKKFILDRKKISEIKKRDVNKITNCEDCFAKFTCAGDCPAKMLVLNKSWYNTENNPRCIVHRGILNYKLKQRLTKH